MQTKMKHVRQTTFIRCQECGEVLTDKESIARGIGPVCAAKRAADFATLGTVQAAVAQGYTDARIAEHLRAYDRLLRIKQQREAASGYVAPNLIQDLRAARRRVIRRAQELKLDQMTVVQIVASARINFWIVEEAA